MSFSRPNRLPSTPTLPKGETVASYGTYLEAQRAVDHLADSQFPVQHVTIVGPDLQMVERVLRRLFPEYSQSQRAGIEGDIEAHFEGLGKSQDLTGFENLSGIKYC